jgi:hypothetical protein
MNLTEVLEINNNHVPFTGSRGMFCASRWWLEAGQPVERVALSCFLDDTLKRCAKEGIRYPKILLLRLKQLQRHEWEPREELTRIFHPNFSSGSGLFFGSSSGRGGFQTVTEFLSGGDSEEELREIDNSIERMEGTGEYDPLDMAVLSSEKTRLESKREKPSASAGEHGVIEAGDSPSKKPVFQLAIPRERLDGFGTIVLHYANDGHETLEEIERKVVTWCREHHFPLPGDPGSEVRRILRRLK